MATKKKPPKTLEPEPNPKAPLAGQALLKQAQSVLKVLAEDLLARARGSASVSQALRARHEKEKAAERTADNHDTWRRNFVEQVAAAWFLSCVFVRTLEDQGLLERNRVAGPGALDSQRAFFALCPSLSERDYLLTVFRELCHLPAAADLFDPRHNPVWLLGPSAEATRKLLELFRAPLAETPAFRFGQEDTRFLGDLYQDLSEDVRKRYALLQTPRFVESFILDRTLTPAVERFGLGDTKLIDPTCGSGHFLLGAFDRLFEAWLNKEPAAGERSAAQKALDAVHGADINPYAVAIARFRLTLAFLEKGGYARLKDAPRLPLHVVVADSLLHNPHGAQQELGDVAGTSVARWKGSEFQLEDEAAAREVLYQRFAAVVGNPPYITVKDAALRERYRGIYSTAFREYSLAVPFKERFFQLARARGHVGMITANSFMKREFGKKLIEEYLPTVNLEAVVNTSGAYIPGHGTPTVLLFGTSEPPQSSDLVTVLANRGEPKTPDDAEQGLVWQSIAQHWDEVGFENDFVSVVSMGRTRLSRHPWSLGGGGANELKALLEERADRKLADVVDSIGFMCITKQDEVFSLPAGCLSRHGLPVESVRVFVIGEHIRDWAIASDDEVLFPYDRGARVRRFSNTSAEIRFLWPFRVILESRAVFGGKTFKGVGRTWYEYGQIPPDRTEGPAITFAFVATHNHFVLDRGGKVFKQSAPIIKLPEGATEDDHYALLAYLNSSTAGFYCRQVLHSKGAQGVNEGHKAEEWEQFLEFSGTQIGKLPLPNDWKSLAPLGRLMTKLVAELDSVMPHAWIDAWNRGKGPLTLDAGTAPRDMQQRLVAVQEEIDWAVYALFGLQDARAEAEQAQLRQRLFGDLTRIDTRQASQFPGELAAGHRPFELLMERGDTQWFTRNGYENVTEPEAYGPEAAAVLRARMSAIGANHNLALIEQPQFKRRWTLRDVEGDAQASLRNWALSRVEDALRISSPGTATTIAVAWMRADAERASEASPHLGDVVGWTRDQLKAHAIPFLAAHRYTETGLEKHRAWEHTWDLQRKEDAGENVGDIPVPPKYAQGDFQSSDYWRARGKLDVPKERFISYLGCESDEDKQPIYGWAGWDHLQRAKALAELYDHRKNTEGWPKERLQPILAGLLELLPWLLQWHNTPSEDLGGGKPGEQFSLFLEAECAEHGFTHEDLRDWRPEKKGRAKAKTLKAEPEDE